MVGTTLSSPGVVPTVMGATLLAAGANHTCAGGASGVSCWGDDSAGQTGGGAMGTPVSPSAVVGATSATALTAGAERTCLVANQGVSCWGGQGFSAATGQVDASPTIVNGLDGATTIAAGRFHLCSLGAGSVVSCVGRNDEGQLGVGTSGSSTSTTTPSLVGGLSGVTRVASGDLHTCALVGSGAVYCWGDASRGQLGEGTSGTGMLLSSPTLVTGLIGKAVSTGGFHSCAITSSSKVVCWGANDQAQLGDSTGADHATPVEVAF
jgi:alpha-tubulin suppressor-like RCC1 family protein